MFFFFDEESNKMVPSNYTEATFEDIKHIDDDGNEFWYARELQVVLGYSKWGNFNNVIKKAKIACENAGRLILDDFADVGKIVPAGATQKDIGDIKLTRYACYLIAQNGDPRKKVIALAQAYFAVQTRKQELSEQVFEELSEDERRLHLRRSVKDFNKKLSNAAHDSGVKDYGKFHNAGYRGLYAGETAEDIKSRKGLEQKQDILDHMGATELAANYFRITQTEEKLRKDKVRGENPACSVHYTVGKKVRDTMIELSGTRPEELPTPMKSIKDLEKEEKARLGNRSVKRVSK